VEQWAEGKEEQRIGATKTSLLKEENMGVFHSHNVLCVVIFARNAIEKGKEVAMKRIDIKRVDNSSIVDIEERSALMH